MARKPVPRTYRFTAPLERMNAEMAFMYVEVPIDVEQEFGTRSRVRVLGTVNGVAVDRALMPQKSGVHIIILGGDIRRAAKVKKVGDPVQVEFWAHPNPSQVELPEELAETLDFIPEMKAGWDKLTPGCSAAWPTGWEAPRPRPRGPNGSQSSCAVSKRGISRWAKGRSEADQASKTRLSALAPRSSSMRSRSETNSGGPQR